jgi:hypothetical protein
MPRIELFMRIILNQVSWLDKIPGGKQYLNKINATGMNQFGVMDFKL